MISIPRGWTYEPLTKFIDSRSGNGKLIKGKQSLEFIKGFFPAYSASGQDIWTEKAEFFGEGVVVSAVGARCGKAFLAEGSWTAVANTHVLQIKKGAELDIRFLWYLCNDEKWWIRSGTAQPFVKVKDTLERLQLVPPLAEQHKIVELLEDHLSRLDAALADVKQAKLKAAQFKVAFLRNVFSGDASWNSIPMKQLGKWGGGGTPSKANEKFWTDGTVPWLSPKDMGPLEITQTVDKITEEACLNSTVKKIPENSVVFVVRSGILERKLPIALTKVETTLNQDMKALTFSDKVNPKFGFYSMLGLEQDILRTCRKSGTTVASINTESLMNYEIKIPSLPVQAEILDYVDSQLTLIDNSVSQVESVLKVGNSLRRSLLQAAFTGQLTKEVVSV
jgi:type I restriction enzyme S subunit